MEQVQYLVDQHCASRGVDSPYSNIACKFVCNTER